MARGKASLIVRISVVIPCFNGEAFLAPALDSIISQSLPVTDIVIVDDGSSDGSATQATRLAKKTSIPVLVIQQVNRGVASARNTGIAHASGDVIAFLDADDRWPPESLEIRIAALDRDRADVAFGRVRQCALGENGRLSGIGDEMAGRLAGAMLVRREALARIGLFDESFRSAETIDWIARAEESGCRQTFVDATVLYRVIHGGNMMLGKTNQEGTRIAALRQAVHRRRIAASG